MKVLELFAGFKSISKAFEKAGHETFTIDSNADYKPNLCIDVLKLESQHLAFYNLKPNIIWASPPCNKFSLLTIRKNWNNGQAKTEEARHAMRLVLKTLSLIYELNPDYWFIENPMAMLRKMPFMQGYHRKSITYCSYGYPFRKPTDIWTNLVSWIPKSQCSLGDPCHVHVKRGKKPNRKWQSGGIQDAANRIKNELPRQLCWEIVQACENPKQNLSQFL